jgi:signal peptidase
LEKGGSRVELHHIDHAISQGEAKEMTVSMPTFTELVQTVLGKGAPLRFHARGYSMFPFIRNGDLVTLSPIHGSCPSLGDVVAFIHPDTGRLTVHRVVGREGESYLVKGDSSSQTDGLIPGANVMGYVTEIERGEGRKVSLGLGPGRFLIAFLARVGLLWALVLPLWKLARAIERVRNPVH